MLLPKVNCTAHQRGELRDLVQIFRMAVIDVSHTTLTLEVQGREDKMSAVADLLEPYGGCASRPMSCVQPLTTPGLEHMMQNGMGRLSEPQCYHCRAQHGIGRSAQSGI